MLQPVDTKTNMDTNETTNQSAQPSSEVLPTPNDQLKTTILGELSLPSSSPTEEVKPSTIDERLIFGEPTPPISSAAMSRQAQFEQIKRMQQLSRVDRIRQLQSASLLSSSEARKMIAASPKEQASAQPGQPTIAWLDRFITTDETLLRVKEQVKKLSFAQEPVLIQGDSGTGKELIARALHGTRCGKFVDLNCAGLPDNLIESELFGHVKGAFTGAWQDKAGLFQEAQNGTIFLDEIGELRPLLQSKLLRVIQQRVIRRVGSNDNEDINCRIVCASHKHILSAVSDGEFRLDLYYRLAVFELELKPLCERPLEDFQLLVKSLGGDDEDAEYLYANRPRLAGNIRSVQRYMSRKRVLGITEF